MRRNACPSSRRANPLVKMGLTSKVIHTWRKKVAAARQTREVAERALFEAMAKRRSSIGSPVQLSLSKVEEEEEDGVKTARRSVLPSAVANDRLRRRRQSIN
mmetsp:Transcript_8366/g.22294  ORF Transcript_8366/g.22294 Transcript_8366/m.22294 type:complete len:102 (+) Transcript_8366:2566-2871(+)